MEGTIAEIRMFGGNFSPKNWAFCQGQLISIAQNTALFALLGTTFGGNGQTTFALPDFRGRMPVGQGQGPGLSPYSLGQVGGVETVTLTTLNMPAHNHVVGGTVTLPVNATNGNTDTPQDANLSAFAGGNMFSAAHEVSMGAMSQNLAVGLAGAGQPFSHRQPVLGMNFIVCMYGIFPSRN